MDDEKTCPSCKMEVLDKRIGYIGVGGTNGSFPELERREYYWCKGCKKVFFEEALKFYFRNS